ncbi:MAG: pentapeptide repeat-containing protein, partial [Thermoanaerobaculia bacterium]
ARADLRDANLSGTTLADAELTGADLRGAKLDGMSCARCDLSGAQLDRKTLQAAKLESADLQNANIFPALLSDTTEVSTNEPWTCGYSDLSRVTKRMHVSTKGRDTDDCGATPTGACLTIAKGIAQCKKAPAGCAVLVAFGDYQLKETLQLAAGINLYGGCVAGPPKKDLQSLIRGADGWIGVQSASTGEKTIQGFEILGGNAQTGQGAPAMALHIVDRTVVLNSRIVAGAGAKGRPGSNAVAGTKGGDASGSTPGANSTCSNAGGGSGGAGRRVSVENYWDGVVPKFRCTGSCPGGCDGSTGASGEASGGKGGGRGGDNCAECPVSSAGNGGGGDGGTNAGCGGGGVPDPAIMGSFNAAGYWQPVTGGSGQRGKVGGGGGGGGGGGYFAGSCFFVKTERNGGGGGGGGAGGCGASEGFGGQQGGASIAIAVNGGPLVIKDSRVTGGLGGDGGDGGNGQKGGDGGSGAGGSGGESGAGTGGNGGKGGAGGASGGGAGGNAGPSIGIALSSRGTVEESNVAYYVGLPGKPGGRGKGGAKIIDNVCAGSDGQDGLQSKAVEKQKF